MKIDWKKKLTSRKLWAAIAAFVTAVLAAFAVPDIKIEQVVAVVSACGVMVAYIVGEGLVDSKSTNPQSSDNDTTETK